MLAMNLWLCRRSMARGRIKVVRDVEVGPGVGIGQGAEGVDVLDGAERGLVQSAVAAALRDLDVRERAVAFDLEGDVDAMAVGLRIEHLRVPLLGDLLGDLLDVVGEAGAEAGVGDVGAKGAGLGLDAAHGDAGGSLAGSGLVEVGRGGARGGRRGPRGSA